MNLDRRVELGRGDGTVVRLPGLALFVPGEEAPEGLLDIARTAAGTQTPGRSLARGLAGILTGEHADAVPPFGAVAEVEGGMLVFLYGSVTAQTADGTIQLSGSDATTWVDRILGDEHAPVTLAGDGQHVGADVSPFDLREGIVPGGWLRVAAGPSPDAASGQAAPDAASGRMPEAVSEEPVTAPMDAVPPAPPPLAPPATTPVDDAVGAAATSTDSGVSDPPAPDEAGAGDGPPAAEPAEPTTEPLPASFEAFSLTPDRGTLREPLPAEGAEPSSGGGASDPVPEHKLVDGILCSRQHFNSPDAVYCSSCGISMVHQTHNLVRRERPPLGFLVFDDGSTFTLDDRYVLGREPETDPRVSSQEARPIPLDDPQMSVSRVHAEIELVGWDVQLMDRGSTNGTHVLNATGDGWDRLVPDQPRIVPPGSRIAVGQRTFVYETPQRG